MKKLSQKAEIRRYLEAGGKLTQLAALNFWGCMRLSSRIGEINEDLHNEWLAKGPFKYPLVDKRSPKLIQVKTEIVVTNANKRIGQYSLKRVD